MKTDRSKNSFDELVAGISSEERKFLLAKLNKNRDDSIQILQPLRSEPEDTGTVDVKFKSESVIYKFILWIRSFFMKKSVVELYNDDLVAELASKINKLHPGLIDYKHGFLQPLFYEKLKELKNCADFFKPYFSVVNDSPENFYVFLSTFAAPEITVQINSEADPYTIPFDREPSTELRTSLIRRLEIALKSIEPDSRARLYSSVRSLNWLQQFTQLPFLHFIAQFTAVISDSYTCPFYNSRVDIPAFARVLLDAHSVSNEALEALFLYPRRKSGANIKLSDDTENTMREFLSKAASSFSMIQMFISTVPLGAIGRVVADDYNWQVEQNGGAEDWFIKFREEWKRIFDERWDSWLRDRKKDQLGLVLKKDFGLDDFPELPYRPWATLWGGITFRCELTGGFLAWFAAAKYQQVMQVLNVIILEGVFLNNDNRTELSEAVNIFADVNQKISLFVDSLEVQGSIGSVFDKIDSEHARTLKKQSLIDSVILTAESNIRDYEFRFCDACRSMERVFHGILDEQKEKNYDTLQNLLTIKGRENREFRDKLAETREILRNARSLLAEIEPLDLPAKAEKLSVAGVASV